jgi:cation:H+ antiporter
MAALSFVAGLVLLVVGAEALVRGASRLAARVGVPPLVVGLTVVAFGTSAPELAVNLGAALSGQAGVAVGNVVGSNVFNVLFVLGLSALVAPLLVQRQLVRLDVPLMVALSLAVLWCARDGLLARAEGIALVLALFVYLALLFAKGRRTPEELQAEDPVAVGGGRTAMDLLLVVGGLGLLVLGSRWLVSGAVSFAEGMGVSPEVIALTIVAAGTSLPEVVTSVVAALKGERDIAVGNVVGSNLFNLMAVLGISALAAPGGIEVSPNVVRFDLPVMCAVAFACMPVFFTGGVISRAEGVLFLAYYAAYTTWLVLGATGSEAHGLLGVALLWFALPLTAVTLLVIVVRERGRRRAA